MAITSKSNILNWSNDKISTSPTESGVYVLRNFPAISGIVYIGSANNLRRRLEEHWLNEDIPEVLHFDWYVTDSLASAEELEKTWIQKYTPKYNERVG